MIRADDLPVSWFDRPLYAPRVANASGDRWFLDAHPELASPGPDAAQLANAARRGDRRALRDAFAMTYREWSLPKATAAAVAIDALVDGDAACVVTGQQPGFLGGPYYTLYKALTAIAIADRATERSGRRCVPVFWVAGEDHDIDEVRTARLRQPNGETAQVSLPHAAERRPLSTLPISGVADDALERARALLATAPHAADALALVDLYRERNVASGFAAIIASLLGEHGLVIIDPETLRALARPLVRRLIEAPAGALERIEAGGDEFADRCGLRAFVRSRLPLFVLRDGRRDHLSPEADGLRVDGGDTRFTRRELLALLDAHPERFSSGALLRPLVQQATLPCALTVGGPAEVGYFAQLGPLARWLGVEPPAVSLRFHATWLDRPALRAWRRLGIPIERLAESRDVEMLATSAPRDADPLAELDELRARAVEIAEELATDFPGARKGIDRGARDIESSFDRLTERARKGRARANEERFAAATTLWNAIFPDGALEERRFAMISLVATHGRGGMRELLDVVRAALARDAARGITVGPHRLLRAGDGNG